MYPAPSEHEQPSMGMEGHLRARMNEQDMNQRLQHFQQQRQGIDFPHPPVSYTAPPAASSHVPYDPPQNIHHPSTPSSYPYDTDGPIQSHSQQSMITTPPSQFHQTLPQSLGVREDINRAYHSEMKTTPKSPAHSRQRITCIHPNGPNEIQWKQPETEAQSKMIGARILSITIPVVDYNINEHTNILSASMNYLDATAGRWQPVILPIGSYQSRRKLLNVFVAALSKSFPLVHFTYEYDRNRDGRCSIESVVIEEDANEHGCHALYFDTSNPKLLAFLGIQVEHTQQMIEPQQQWDTEEDDGYRETKCHHSQIVGAYPMNLLLPTHLNLWIPELGASVMVSLHNARYGEYLHFELIDEDGVVDLAHSNSVFGGCTAVTQLTPQLTYPEGSEYNCRNMPIALHVEFLLEERQ